MKSLRHLLLFSGLITMAALQSLAGTTNGNTGANDSAKMTRNAEPVFDFFDSDEVLEMTLTFDIKGFVKTKFDPDTLFNAELTVMTTERDSLTQDIKLRARGKMRRQYCSFPPIMLKIKNKKNEPAFFPKSNIKLVTHCSQAGNFENYILKEYLAYKLYNLVTPYSFKTRLVMVHYVDVNRPKASYSEYGFLIEDDDDLAARNNTMLVENLHVTQNHMDVYEMARVAFFNYMIGNTDWSVQEQHNLKVLKTNDPTINKGIPVTYDFDYSGFVNTVYATPNDKIPITHVTERYFKGTCLSDELVKSVMNEFEAMQPLFIQLIEEFDYISQGQKKQAVIYINGFFKKYGREHALLSDINRTCLKI